MTTDELTPLSAPSAPSPETCGSPEPETGYECELAKDHTGLHRAFTDSFDEDGQVPERTWRAGAIVKSATDNRNTATEAVAPTQITASRQQPAIAPSAPSPEEARPSASDILDWMADHEDAWPSFRREVDPQMLAVGVSNFWEFLRENDAPRLWRTSIRRSRRLPISGSAIRVGCCEA